MADSHNISDLKGRYRTMNNGEISGYLLSISLSMIFLVTGALAVYAMLARWGKNDISRVHFYIKLHRIAGWSFTTLFVYFFANMLPRLANFTNEFPARISTHFTLAIALLFLLAIKVTIPRYFPNLGSNLFFLGVGVYMLAFPMVLVTAGYHGVKIVLHQVVSEKHAPQARIGNAVVASKSLNCDTQETTLKQEGDGECGETPKRPARRQVSKR